LIGRFLLYYELLVNCRYRFSDIGDIKRRVLGESASYKKKKKLSKVAQALELFSLNKTSMEVAIELDIDPIHVEKIYLNYLGLNRLHQLVKIYQELGNYLPNLINEIRISQEIKLNDFRNYLTINSFAEFCEVVEGISNLQFEVLEENVFRLLEQ
jgi:hypothetical protein